ncbi:glycine cleavage system aminomethyltransferase GcvT [Rubricoccus marinus]|uniref:Aminomethyltransferase n=1 Tax=Rubricoccus marinus TaxID=716817 RepID=A0A259TYY7_9BACT|nr:glycine cleavage system aminomethyltransferase GcvT [Rubricoccus marinus]OZC02798.1 glycine cleavage system protein T [Rubricoccus marinus]
MSDALKTTPLHAQHVALGAKMMPFAGWDMPVQYSGILDEHHAVRNAAGLFDVSHMGEVAVQGPDAQAFIQHLVTNDVSRIVDGQAQYTVMCHESGTAVDDLLVYRLAHEDWMLVINASNIDKDLAHMRDVHGAGDWDCTLTDLSDQTALIALQGPLAFEILGEVTDAVPADLPFYRFVAPEAGTFLGCESPIVSHTGYTGEAGVEIYCTPEEAPRVWEALMEAGSARGLLPAGLGARDTLRLESGFCLYGHELSDEITPLEAGVGWVVKLDAGDFVGAEALREQKASGVPRKLVGLVVEGRGIPREGYEIASGDRVIGTVTSGTQSPVLAQGIGLGLVENDPAYTAPGSALAIRVRGRELAATVAKPPFHKQK